LTAFANTSPGRMLSVLGQFTRFAGELLLLAFRPPYYLAQTREAFQAVSFQCLLPVLSIMTAVGIFGAEHVLSSLLAESILRELAPTLSCIMIAAQAGTAIAGEIGTMRVKEEIDALAVMAVPPLKFIVVPRLFALVLACPIVTLFGSAAAMVGGYLVAVLLKGVTRGVFVANLLEFVRMSILMGGVVKSIVFGLLIGLIACFYGYHVTGGAQGVGQAANRTVVNAIVAIAIFNYFITSIWVKVFG